MENTDMSTPDCCSSDTPLHTAVRQNSKEKVEILLKNGANVSVYNQRLETPLNIALRQNSTEIIEILLNSINAHTLLNFNTSPLHIAVGLTLKKTVEALLTKDAPVSFRNQFFKTLLNIAVRENSTEIVDILLKNSENRLLVIKENPLIFDYVMESDNESMKNTFLENFTLNEIVTSCNIKILKIFIEKGFNVNTAAESGETPLHCAVQCKFEPLANLLLDYGADAKSKDINGLSVLHKAAKYYSSTKLINRLLENGASLNAKDDRGLTPLIHAVNNRHFALINFMFGQDLDLDDKGNKLAFCLAYFKNDIYTVLTKMFVKRGFSLSLEDFNDLIVPTEFFPMKGAFENRELRTRVQKTLNKTATNAEEFRKLFLFYKVLQGSIQSGFNNIVDNLLTSSINVNVPTAEGSTLLNAAIIVQSLPIVEKLLAYGADVNATGKEGQMFALHYSVCLKSQEITAILLKNNADTEVRNTLNQTPLQLAVKSGSHESLLLLLNAGANINPDNVNGTNKFLNARNDLNFVKTLLRFDAVVDHRNFLDLFKRSDSCTIDRENRMKLLLNHAVVCNSHLRILLNWENFRWSSSKFIKLLIKYVTLHGSRIDYDSPETKWYDFRRECQKEIEKMKLTKIEGFEITVDDVLRKTARQIAQYLFNEDFARVLEKMDFRTTFPLYRSKIEAHVKKAQMTKQLLMLSSAYLDDVSKMSLPILVKDRILSYLIDQDLRRLIFLSDFDDAKKALIQYKHENMVDDSEEDDYDSDGCRLFRCDNSSRVEIFRSRLASRLQGLMSDDYY